MALAPAVLLLVYLPGQMMLRCRMDGLLRSVCCCPRGIEESSGPVVKAQDCCHREVAQTQRPKAKAATSPNRQLAPIAAAAVVATALPLVAPPTARFDRAAQRHGPARAGIRVVLLKQAFLI
ncbi:MAG TPA: hypothetical protein VFH68_03335 [Polyangia bacterium]|jgi:hypothetical protein|nr:hypothetical protein [Polyangia bacterium]